MAIPLQLTGLTKVFQTPSGPFVAVKDVNAAMGAGEFVALLGHSGCGKSTVLSIIAGLDRSTYGGVVIEGREVNAPGPDRAIVFQTPSLLPWLTAEQNVRLARRRGRQAGRRDEGATALHYLARHHVFEAARVLTRFELQDTLLRVWEQSGITVVMVTHDVDEALYVADRLILMTDGPEATVGDTLRVPFPRPRTRASVLAHPDYPACRRRVIDFLEVHARQSRPSVLDDLLHDPSM